MIWWRQTVPLKQDVSMMVIKYNNRPAVKPYSSYKHDEIVAALVRLHLLFTTGEYTLHVMYIDVSFSLLTYFAMPKYQVYTYFIKR